MVSWSWTIGAEDRLNAEFALPKAFLELALTTNQQLERESDAP